MTQKIGQDLPQGLVNLAKWAKEEGRGAIWYHVMDAAYRNKQAHAVFEKEWGLPSFSAINLAGEAATTKGEFNAAADAYREYMASFKVYMTVALGLESKAPIKVQQWVNVFKSTGQKRFDTEFGIVEDTRPSAAQAISIIKAKRL